jgi:hypothetical protein
MRLTPASETRFASVECSGIAVSLSGSVVGTITGAIDRMAVTSGLKLKASKGRQIPEHLEDGGTSVLSVAVGVDRLEA